MMNERRMSILGYEIGMIYHPNFEESLWNVTAIGETVLGYSETTVRTNLVGIGRNQASKAWSNICNKVVKQGDAYYARPRDIINFLKDTVDVGTMKFKEKAELLLNRNFLIELKDAWSTFSQ